MANFRYSKGAEAILSGAINLGTSDVAIQLYNNSPIFVFDDTHEFKSSITADEIGDPVIITNKEFTDGKMTADVGAFIPDVDDIVRGLAVYVDTGNSATSNLLSFINKKEDGTNLIIEVQINEPFSLNWTGPIYSIGGT